MRMWQACWKNCRLIGAQGENRSKPSLHQWCPCHRKFDDSVVFSGEKARLHELKGFGEALQQKVSELVTVGSLKYHQDLKASIPLVGSTCCRSRAWAPRSESTKPDLAY